MPWKESTIMSERSKFIEQAKVEGTNMSALCRELGISRKTGYKWLKREQEGGAGGIEDRSRRPKHSPQRTEAKMEAEVMGVRNEHPVWGGRKIKRVLEDRKIEGVPASSTITAILRRHDQIDPQEAQKHKPFQRFERAQPNELWQMDFKGYFALNAGGYCHPLTVIDDHSRFLLGLKACPDETYPTVQAQLSAIFEQFGLPERMLMDNGSPWGNDREHPYTILTTWLLRLDIAISHGRPRHPQTQGKDERLNRTLLDEVISQQSLATLQECQLAFDQWWRVYNYIRPHEAIALDTPASHYQLSSRPFPTALPPATYEPDDLIRKVDQSGKIFFNNRCFRVGKAFRHQPVALRSTETDGLFDVFFSKHKVAQINLRMDNC
jgi:transposase InsO family protein